MKIRIGFVSNSSSSSYVILLTKDQFDKIIESMTAFEIAIVNLLDPQPTKCFDMDMIVVDWCSGNYDTFQNVHPDEKIIQLYKEMMGEDVDEDYFDDDVRDKMYSIRDKFDTLADQCGGFTHSVDT